MTAADVQWFVAQHTSTVAAALNQGSLQAPAPIDLDSSTYKGISCYWFENQNGTQGSKLTGVQCAFTSSQDGTNNDPIPLITSAGLLADLNQWLADNVAGVSIQLSSLVAIEAIGGKGRNGDSCDTCSSGKGGGGGYAISVQTLGGMQQLISENADYVDETTPPLLFVYVGKEGKGPGDQKGGGGGAGSIVMGQPIVDIPQIDVLYPGSGTDSDGLVFTMAGGGGGGGGARGSGDGKHGRDGGTMSSNGPVTGNDHTAKGSNGDGGNGGQGGSQGGSGLGGQGGAGNSGASGIGGEGGMGAAFADSTTVWPYGLGGPIGGDKGEGGAGGGGWGGGGGAGEGNNHGHGGGGGGSWARMSVDTATALPTLYNLNGSGFSISNAGFSQVVISFEAEAE